jgi:putative pyruvate formate lyase activating enzyme
MYFIILMLFFILSSCTPDYYDNTVDKKPELYQLYRSCILCPRACGVNRLRGQAGFCGQTQTMKLACACLHKGEEPPLCGEYGSGTLFFSGCTLQCVSCQNRQLSGRGPETAVLASGVGGEVTPVELAEIMFRLQEKGACNINIVTGSHFIPGIITALEAAHGMGMHLPVVWNTSGYENRETIRLLAPFVDIFLTDIKTLDSEPARLLCGAADYPQRAAESVRAMAAAKSLVWKGDLLTQGVIVRHLVLPGKISATRQVLAWYKQNLDPGTLLSLMVQFLPIPQSGSPRGAEVKYVTEVAHENRRLTKNEYDRVMQYLHTYEIDEGFVQDPAEDDSWLPDFTRKNPFPDGCAGTIWHYRFGYVMDE